MHVDTTIDITVVYAKPLRTIVPIMHHENETFDICKQVTVTLLSLA